MVSKRGFTLIELLVVIAIIALLLAIIVPALKNAKELASGSVCLSNQKNLALAWTNYSGDYDSYLVGGSNYYAGTRATPYRWVEPPLMSDKQSRTDSSCPELSIHLNHERTVFVQEDCFLTRRTKNYIIVPVIKITQSRSCRSVPQLCNYRLMNGEDFISRSGGIRTPINQYRTASVLGNKTLYVAVKTSDIVSPGNKHVFIEEDVSAKGQNVNAGGFVLLNPWWWDWPAYYHNDSSTIGFADGHAERHRWQNMNTLKLMRGEIASDPDAAKTRI
jgi:prepilin-type N-terminal cleavage/methylation domain-containing protein/prepilin-type processing-associated H-X9-DG protein